MAAVGLLQDWSGFAILHTVIPQCEYQHNRQGGNLERNRRFLQRGVFNTWNDPAKFGLFIMLL